jgi:hypothetical protein
MAASGRGAGGPEIEEMESGDTPEVGEAGEDESEW